MEEKVVGLENLVDLKDNQLAVLKVMVKQNKMGLNFFNLRMGRAFPMVPKKI